MEKEYDFKDGDKEQIKRQGVSLEVVYEQLRLFKEGIPPVKLAAPATTGNGIICFNSAQIQGFVKKYNQSKKSRIKFTPASGAATRMFKILHRFVEEYHPHKEDLNSFLNKTENTYLKQLFNQLHKLPFYELAKQRMQTSFPQADEEHSEVWKYNFVKTILNDLNYAEYPKGLIPFHHYPDKTVTAFEEHFREALEYNTLDGRSKLHFTISKEHLNLFKSEFLQIQKKLKHHPVQLDASFSYQESATDTIAVTPDNIPYRDKDGNLYFRPGGHGALIQNLNKIKTDIIFIKNIDNVVLEKNLNLAATYKKALAGLLLTIQEKVFSLLEEVDVISFSTYTKEKAEDLALEYFHRQKDFESADEIKSFFNRPIRVCGMVKNEGEPGGGPFWVRATHPDKYSLQIIESSQINKDDPKQIAILNNSSHFNPVDIVCGVMDYRGQKFDLNQYVAPHQAFISRKSIGETPIKALELPGLWNGGMAYWNTIFVEVPLLTFNPVKTILDLLRPEHQA